MKLNEYEIKLRDDVASRVTSAIIAADETPGLSHDELQQAIEDGFRAGLAFIKQRRKLDRDESD